MSEQAAPSSERTVLVTGGAGYVGSALLPRLLESGWRVRVIDTLLWGEAPIAPWLNHAHLELIRADFRDVEVVVRALKGAEAVIHLGGIVGDQACDLDEQRTVEINVTATRLLAEAARGMGVSRFIFASTGAVYGACDRFMSEESPLNPVSLYARTKIAGERILLELAGPTFSPTILRFGTIFGLSGRIRFDLVVNLLTAKALIDRQITVYGGEQWRTFVHVDDAANALFSVLQAPREQVHRQIFNTGSNQQTYTIRAVGELIHAHVPQAELLVSQSQDASDYRIDCTRIQQRLGYTTRWTVEDGIRQVRSAVENGSVEDYRAEQYSNVKFMANGGKDLLQHRGERWAYELLERIRQETERVNGCE